MDTTSSLIPLFDIDWTLLVGKNQAHIDAFRYMFTTVYDEPSASLLEIKPHGMIDAQIIVEILKVHGMSEENSKKNLPNAFSAMNQYYESHASANDVVKLAGVDTLLTALKEMHVTMGILSGNIEGMAWNKLEVAGIRQYFSFGVFGDMALRRSELVGIAKKRLLEKYGFEIPTDRFVIIGDSSLDIACAKEAGTKSIGVATGSSSEDILREAGADLVVSTLESVEEIATFIFPSYV